MLPTCLIRVRPRAQSGCAPTAAPRFYSTKVKTGLGKAERDFLSTKPISQEISYFSYLRWLLASLLARIRVHLRC